MLCLNPEERPSAACILSSAHVQDHLRNITHAQTGCAPVAKSKGESCDIDTEEKNTGPHDLGQSHLWEDKIHTMEDNLSNEEEEDCDAQCVGVDTQCDCWYPEDFDEDETLSSGEEHSENSWSPKRSDSAEHIVSPEVLDISEQDDYPDDFEEDEEREDDDNGPDFVHTDAPQQPHDKDGLEEVFQLCDAGGLSVTLKALKDKNI
ncbi:hypothetical protein INR49_024803 [Caranx melampygus]|nr:hypothetical protein INR49_024803 [Caranx melampygus]